MDPEDEIENPGLNDGEQNEEQEEVEEAVALDESVAPPVEEASAPEARQRNAPTANLQGFSEEQLTHLRDLSYTDPIAAMDQFFQARLAQYENVRAVTNHFVNEDARQHPDWHREHGATMDRMLTQLPANIRTTKEGVETARLMVMREQIASGADAIAVYEEHLSALKGKNRRSPAAPVTQTAPIPAAQRMAQSSGGTGGGSGATVTTRGQKAESRSEAYMKNLGLGSGVVKALRDEEGILEK